MAVGGILEVYERNLEYRAMRNEFAEKQVVAEFDKEALDGSVLPRFVWLDETIQVARWKHHLPQFGTFVENDGLRFGELYINTVRISPALDRAT